MISTINMQNRLLIVLGIYHSGTSLLAGCFNLLGINLGNSITLSNSINETKCDEENDIRLIHDNLLKNIGCRWDEIVNLPEGWTDSEAAQITENKMISLIERKSAETQLLAVSDPRICLLLPLWQNILNRIDMLPLFVIMIRHPFEVAVSLNKRYQMDILKGHLLWLIHYREAFNACLRHSHTIVNCDQLRTDPLSTLKDIGQVLDISFPLDMDSRNGLIRDWVATESNRYLCDRPPDKDTEGVLSSYDWIYYLMQDVLKYEALNRELAIKLSSQELLTKEYFVELAKSESQQIIQQERTEIFQHLAEDRLRQIELTNRQFNDSTHRKDAQLVDIMSQLSKISEQQKIITEKQLLEKTIYQNIERLNNWLRQVENDYISLKKSYRWKAGNTLVRLLEIMLLRTKHPIVIDHIDKLFREHRSWLPRLGEGQQNQEYLVALMQQIKNDVAALKNSKRWWLGNMVVSFIERLLLKKKHLLSIDHMDFIIDEYTGWINALRKGKEKFVGNSIHCANSLKSSNEVPKTILCAIVKNEMEYLLEWIAYHKIIGFEKIVIYDNDSQDGTSRVLEVLHENNVIQHISWCDKISRVPQLSAYKDALERQSCEWICFLDADEFLNLSNTHYTIGSFLDSFSQNVGAIGMNWKVFGSNGNIKMNNGLVVERFTRCAEFNHPHNRHIKSLYRMNAVHSVHAHCGQLHAGYDYVDVAQKKVVVQHNGLLEQIIHSPVCVHHYVVKSLEEYEKKKKRGNVLRTPDNLDKYSKYSDVFFQSHDLNECEDKSILVSVQDVKNEMRELIQLLPPSLRSQYNRQIC